jgi:hypothetical protein
MLVQSYLIVSAVFFLLSAIAQLNDPDPILWAGLYVAAGSVLNMAVLAGRKGGAVLLLADVFAAGCTLYTLYISFVLVKGHWDEFAHVASAGAAVWMFVEFEEGREAAGLALLGINCLVIAALAGKTDKVLCIRCGVASSLAHPPRGLRAPAPGFSFSGPR